MWCKLSCLWKYCSAASVLMIAVALCGCGDDRADKKVVVSFSGPEGMTMSYNGKELSGVTRRMYPGVYLFKFTAPGYKPLWKKFKISAASNNSSENVDMELERSAVIVSCFVDGKAKDPGAKVFFNGNEYGATPCLISGLEPGVHEILLSHPGFAPKKLLIKVIDGRPLPLIREKLISISGMLQVQGYPEGARLFIGDKFVGVVPYQAKFDSGKYLLELRAPGYVSQKQEVTVVPDQVVRKMIRLKPEPSTVEVTSEPANAACFVNGKKYGTTPCKVDNLVPGNYRIELRLAGFTDHVEMIDVKPGSHEQLKVTMESGYGSARLNILPAGVDVFVDGKPVGKTVPHARFANETEPIVLKELAPGRHVCRISHPQGKPRTVKDFTFIVVKNKMTECPVVEMWVPNAEITYVANGLTDKVKVIRIDEQEVEYSPQPGVSVTEKLKNVRVRKFEAR